MITERPELRFRPGAELYLGPDESNLQKVAVSSARTFKQGYLVGFETYPDRTAVERIRGMGLYIPKTEALELGEGRYYQHQLIGLLVEDESGTKLGCVRAITEISLYDLLEIETLSGGNFLLPLIDEFVIEIDLDAGRITVRPPEGLMDV